MMERLRSLNEFNGLRERLRDGYDPATPVIVISAGTCGQASGANDLIRITKRELLARGLTERIHLRVMGCHGYCQTEPVATPLIIVWVLSDQATKDRCMRPGANAYLGKPVERHSLIAAVKAQIAGRAKPKSSGK